MSNTTKEPPATPKPPSGLRTRGKRLWAELHTTGDFSGCPETQLIAEEACYLADEIERQRRLASIFRERFDWWRLGRLSPVR